MQVDNVQMAAYWLTEALPLPMTSMIPMVLLPMLGIMSTGEVAINYLNSTNYMFFGGLIMAIAVEHSGLHNRWVQCYLSVYYF